MRNYLLGTQTYTGNYNYSERFWAFKTNRLCTTVRLLAGN